MSIEAVAIALHHSQASGTAKLVLIGIANHDGDAGSFPKVATLARYANVHPRRIVEAVRKLEELGEVVTHTQEGGSKNMRDDVRPNMYEFVLVCPPECDRTKSHTLRGPDGLPLKFGRSYKGVYDPDREPRAPRGQAVDNVLADAPQDAVEPGAENSTSAENSTRSSDENSTRPGAENSTTQNHQVNHTMNPALVPSVTSAGGPVEKSAHCEGLHPADGGAHPNCAWRGCGCECHGIRSLVPALPRSRPGRDDAAKGEKVRPGLTAEERSRVQRGAAMARAALRGELAINEALDGK